jgi:hypothetical protein
MAKYRKKPVVIEATQWFKDGDHGAVYRYTGGLDLDCIVCGIHGDHGWIDTLEGGHRVCPGDWIITGVQGEHSPCKPDIFEATYEPVTDAPDA